MPKSIFSNLPNDLIMNIIKMAEDERKNEMIKNNHQRKYYRCMNEMIVEFRHYGNPLFLYSE